MVLNSFSCKSCGKPILLPLEMLQQIGAYQAHPSMDIYPVAVACNHCMTVETYLAGDLLDFEVTSIPRHNWDVLEPWLKCEKASCEADVPLLVDWNAPSSGATKRAKLRALKWGRTYCRAGHPIPKREW